ncbi:MAG TPA: hypothetical protein HA252_03050 [Candidatus Diapherotrites archaeon]|uniref:Transposase n=1 Tax=Candidatus Iainarchaeum sp. TaxID=3101447 RepID=A0A7J4JM73_9ARCH|nr:hypothetical protein [Candidatus Diapherotrites archaeon]HIH16356.1 hypothetical protein [Candidatus Diapherotrites archaeon]
MQARDRKRLAPLFDFIDLLVRWAELHTSSQATHALARQLMRKFSLMRSPNPLMHHLRSRARMN